MTAVSIAYDEVASIAGAILDEPPPGLGYLVFQRADQETLGRILTFDRVINGYLALVVDLGFDDEGQRNVLRAVPVVGLVLYATARECFMDRLDRRRWQRPACHQVGCVAEPRIVTTGLAIWACLAHADPEGGDPLYDLVEGRLVPSTPDEVAPPALRRLAAGGRRA